MHPQKKDENGEEKTKNHYSKTNWEIIHFRST